MKSTYDRTGSDVDIDRLAGRWMFAADYHPIKPLLSRGLENPRFRYKHERPCGGVCGLTRGIVMSRLLGYLSIVVNLVLGFFASGWVSSSEACRNPPGSACNEYYCLLSVHVPCIGSRLQGIAVLQAAFDVYLYKRWIPSWFQITPWLIVMPKMALR